MKNFDGRILFLDRADINTDEIIPARYLTEIAKEALKPHLLEDLSLEGFDPARDTAGKAVVVARRNFGCGSSREHAPWAIKDFGIRCVISTSFADIFFNNCFKNGILPIVMPQEVVDVLMEDARKGANARMTIDLVGQVVTTSDGQEFPFEVDSFKKHCLIEGLDDIGLTMAKAAEIDSFETAAAQSRPWV